MNILKNKEVIDKKIPLKNYFIVLIVSIFVILLVLCLRNFYLNYDSNSINTSYLSEMKINEITKNDFDFILSESSNIILFVSNTKTKQIYNLEKKLYNEFDKNELLDNLIYWDVSDLNNEYISILKNKFPNIILNDYKLPFIVIIKDGIYKDTIDIYKYNNNIEEFIKYVKEAFS